MDPKITFRSDKMCVKASCSANVRQHRFCRASPAMHSLLEDHTVTYRFVRPPQNVGSGSLTGRCQGRQRRRSQQVCDQIQLEQNRRRREGVLQKKFSNFCFMRLQMENSAVLHDWSSKLKSHVVTQNSVLLFN